MHAKQTWQSGDFRKYQVRRSYSWGCELHDNLIVPSFLCILYLTRSLLPNTTMLQSRRLRKGLSSMNEPPRGGRGRGRPPLHIVRDEPGDQPGVHLGKRLRAARERAGLSQEKAAVASETTRNTLGGLEKAKFPNPKLGLLLRIMRTYKLGSIEELLGPMPSDVMATAWEAEEWRGSRERSSQ